MAVHYPTAKILVFSKAPEPGRVKTRLMPEYSAEQAAAIHARLVHHTLATATESELCPVELWCAPDTKHTFFQDCHTTYQIPLKQQRGKNLGERIHHAFQTCLKNSEYVIIVGTDCPSLTLQDFEAAVASLANQHDIVIAPATDGGYVLIGLRRCHLRLFSNIDWGTNQVMQQTWTRIEQLQYHPYILNTHRDVDYAEDLQALPPDLYERFTLKK